MTTKAASPVVSVLMPFLNTERYIRSAALSILAQTIDDLELIAIDDGSSDRSRAELESIDDERLRIVDGPGIGSAAARNVGIRLAAGEFIAFQDSDDVSAPTRLATQLSRLRSQPDLVAVGCPYRAINEEGVTIIATVMLTRPAAIAAAAYSFMPYCGPSLVLRRADYIAVGGQPDGEFSEDYELLLRLLRAGGAVASLAEPLYDYRWHDNTSARNREALDDSLVHFRARHWELSPPDWRVVAGALGAADPPVRRLEASAFLQLGLRLLREGRIGLGAVLGLAVLVGNPRGVFEHLRKAQRDRRRISA